MVPEDNTPIEKIPFPVGAKIRIGIGGLAYCKLASFVSEVNFLSHLHDHNLEIKIVTRNFDTGTVIGKPVVYPINYGYSIFLESSTAVEPDEIEADSTEDEDELEEIINISDLHGVRLAEINPFPAARSKPTPLYIAKCAYYTLEMSRNKYKINRISRATRRRKQEDTRSTRFIGYRMGGKIYCSTDDSLTVISSKGFDDIKLVGVSNKGINLAYDIEFTNHCKPGKCAAKSDFPYYYEVLEDPKTSGKQYDLVAGRSDLAACNPVVTDPPSW